MLSSIYEGDVLYLNLYIYLFNTAMCSIRSFLILCDYQKYLHSKNLEYSMR